MHCCSFTFDLHVLSTPPAFILSQDQTLRKDTSNPHSQIGIRRIGRVLLLTLLSYHSLIVNVLGLAYGQGQEV